MSRFITAALFLLIDISSHYVDDILVFTRSFSLEHVEIRFHTFNLLCLISRGVGRVENIEIFSSNYSAYSHHRQTNTLSYLDNYFNSISKLKTPCEITSLTKVMLQIIYPSIYEKVAKYSTNVEKYFNTINKIIHFSPGDKVMLKNSANSKTDSKFLGPFIIHHCTNNRAYILQDITGNIPPDKVPSSALKPVNPNTPFEEEHYE
ncbi:hypothetical protein QOT17_013788 [Balamuthia mandrillaris]